MTEPSWSDDEFLNKTVTSAIDAVDGSSTGTRVPWMWALLRLPRFRGASHADDHDNRFGHRQVSRSGSRSECRRRGGHPPPLSRAALQVQHTIPQRKIF